MGCLPGSQCVQYSLPHYGEKSVNTVASLLRPSTSDGVVQACGRPRVTSSSRLLLRWSASVDWVCGIIEPSDEFARGSSCGGTVAAEL